MEKARVAGNALYGEASQLTTDPTARAAKLHEAIAAYTTGIDDPAAKADNRRKLLFSNRAAAWNDLGAIATDDQSDEGEARRALYFERALADAEAAIAVDADYAKAYFRAAFACHAAGHFSAASSDDSLFFLSKLFAKDDSFADARDLLLAVEKTDAEQKVSQRAVLSNLFACLRHAFICLRANGYADQLADELPGIVRAVCGARLLRERGGTATVADAAAAAAEAAWPPRRCCRISTPQTCRLTPALWPSSSSTRSTCAQARRC